MIYLRASTGDLDQSRSGRVKGEEIEVRLDRTKNEKRGGGGYENRHFL